MSNNDPVSVPRDELELTVHCLRMAGEDSSADELQQHLDQPAEQHQGEPEVLLLKSGYLYHCDGKPALTDEAVGYVRADQIPNVDSGEIERLRAENDEFDAGMRNLACQLSAGGYNAETLTANELMEKVQWGLTHLAEAHARLVDDLRAQRAERDALLQRMAERLSKAQIFGWDKEIAALSASAEPNDYLKSCKAAFEALAIEPSAPVERDERAEFVKWWTHGTARKVPDTDRDAETGWATWQARAALERKTS